MKYDEILCLIDIMSQIRKSNYKKISSIVKHCKNKGHTACEVLYENQNYIWFFDQEEYLQHVDEAYCNENIVTALQKGTSAITNLFVNVLKIEDFSQKEHLVIAKRHGLVNDNTFKISFRYWVRYPCVATLQTMKYHVQHTECLNINQDSGCILQIFDPNVYTNNRKMYDQRYKT